MTTPVQGAAEHPRREDLFKLYEIHLAEYRFQVELNWKRTQHLLGLNSAMLAAGVGVLRLANGEGGLLAGAIFLAALLLALLALLVSETQGAYYRSAREGKSLVEERLGLGELAVRTTPAMGARRGRRMKVSRAIQWTFGLLALLDAIGLGTVLFELWLA